MASTEETKHKQEKEKPQEPVKVQQIKRTRLEYKLPQPGEIIGGYILSEKIGQGSFGIVFEGHAIHSTKKVAIKIETVSDIKHSQLENEYILYKKLSGVEGFPQIESFGQSELYKHLVMEYLGMSIEDMLAIRNRMFCAKTIFIITKRMIKLIRHLHEIGYVHRDLKPDNFLIGRDPKKIYLIDLGMAKNFITHGQHIATNNGKKLTGTPRYASVNAHEGNELSRKDDLESIGYIILYLCKGKLPWQGLKESKKEKCRIIGEMKKNICLEEVTRDVPGGAQIIEYFNYLSTLTFDTLPDYDYLMSIFDEALSEHGLLDDGIFEWEHVFKGYTEDVSDDSLEDGIIKRKSIWRRVRKLFCCGY
ncbi:casein kinase 1 [Nematocida parisii]|uniref:non-specific serine/threonine protein kinase n=1 Tax=Nematocida parisii (strain ERTm3) TaxID=935791 RepID=I3EJS7_NEMP3|nr:CK1/CK1 protein kinase [Nematocida parisii ERTm1]EIJ89474.1 CK1/CK1 protein kinase [Nematocida parisii ERTm3]KAI5131442.1 casein kinase 1 [Nematocida parisii]EIJ94330.1 CK1/CK1 protein kinase [Nematocida parisii ERTm1]KAI5131471.1 casein kinase 1 [Nematocida parisii]KAI5145562.1 casein kinase 1 [Nematocida parisii]|eukprot:XP_013058826.1 CK1/CK1 protein kinase [Nematocida parisii ERTm1]